MVKLTKRKVVRIMAKGITELVNDFKILHPRAYQKIYNNAIDDVFDFLKSKRDTKYMKVSFDDLEIRAYKNEFKKGGAE